ncbi:MAG TPA: hypothetical protein VEF04_09600 [Blastocatellia bacterium]|nr:hypothetical protein [Blastocatellia bacterium]
MNSFALLKRISGLSLITVLLLALPCLAQSSQSSTMPGKGGKDASCDGALEIVPTQEATFVRKRRPGKGKPVQNKNVNSKTSVQVNR